MTLKTKRTSEKLSDDFAPEAGIGCEDLLLCNLINHLNDESGDIMLIQNTEMASPVLIKMTVGLMALGLGVGYLYYPNIIDDTDYAMRHMPPLVYYYAYYAHHPNEILTPLTLDQDAELFSGCQ